MKIGKGGYVVCIATTIAAMYIGFSAGRVSAKRDRIPDYVPAVQVAHAEKPRPVSCDTTIERIVMYDFDKHVVRQWARPVGIGTSTFYGPETKRLVFMDPNTYLQVIIPVGQLIPNVMIEQCQAHNVYGSNGEWKIRGGMIAPVWADTILKRIQEDWGRGKRD